jgi:hypothetical protein
MRTIAFAASHECCSDSLEFLDLQNEGFPSPSTWVQLAAMHGDISPTRILSAKLDDWLEEEFGKNKEKEAVTGGDQVS